MKNNAKIFIFCLFATLACTAAAQSDDGKGLVDRRVTLQDYESAAAQKAQQSQPKARQNQQPDASSKQAPAADTVARPALPSSFGKIQISAHLDADSITIGDQTTLHIVASGLDGRKISLPMPEKLTSPVIEALESVNDTTRGADGSIASIEQKVTITSFDAGRHYINNIVVGVDDGKSVVLLAPADTLSLTVAYVADADTTKCEVKADADYINEPLTFWEISRWIVLALVVAILVAAIVWIAKRRKEHKPIIVLPGAKPIPADKRALKELEALRRKELWQKGRIKKYYTDTTDIIRRFLHNMYGISASEMTTRQTLKAFHGIADWSEESDTLLRQLLQKADMVKFAKMEPEAYEHDEAMQNAVDFVRKVAETHRINNPEKEGEK